MFGATYYGTSYFGGLVEEAAPPVSSTEVIAVPFWGSAYYGGSYGGASFAEESSDTFTSLDTGVPLFGSISFGEYSPLEISAAHTRGVGDGAVAFDAVTVKVVKFPYVVLYDTLERKVAENPLSKGFGGVGEAGEWQALGFTAGGFAASGEKGFQPGVFKSTVISYGAYWVGSEGFTNPGVTIQLLTLPTKVGEEAHLWLSYDPVKKSGYRLRIALLSIATVPNAYTMAIEKFKEGVKVSLEGSTLNEVAASIVVGTKVGFSMEEGFMRGWLRQGGGIWEKIAEVKDLEFPEGFTGFGGNGSAWRIKHFETGEEAERPREFVQGENSLPFLFVIDTLDRGKTIESPISKAHAGKGAAGEWALPSWYTAGGSVSKTAGWRAPALPTLGAEYGAYYTTQPFVAPAVSVQMVKLAGSISSHVTNLWACLNVAKHDGYRLTVAFHKSLNFYSFVIYKVVAGVATQIGSPQDAKLEAGSQIAITVQFGVIKAWTRGLAGNWQMVTEAADSTWREGYVGFATNGNTQALKNFEAGQNLEGLPFRTLANQAVNANRRSIR